MRRATAEAERARDEAVAQSLVTSQFLAAGIHSAGTALLSVINDLLDFSRIEAAKLVLEEDDFDLPGVLVEVVALVAPLVQAKGS